MDDDTVVPGLAEDGSVRIGADGPGLRVVLPRHAVGAEGSDALDWTSRTVVDDDEIAIDSTYGSLRAAVRHEVSTSTWRVRVSLANGTGDEVSFSHARLAVDPGTGQAWVWAAGVTGLVVLESEGELWALSLRQGRLVREADETSWLPDGTTVPAGRRVILELAGRRCADWDEVASLLPSWLPGLTVRGDEPVDLKLPDAGVVAAECSVLEGPGSTEIRGDGLRRVLVHGAFGEVALECAFAPSLADAVAQGARQLARMVREVPGAVHQLDDTGPSTRARGLERTARRLILLQSAHSHDAADAVRGWLLEGVSDLLHSGGTPGPFAVAALAGEVQRRDDPQALRTLLDALPEVDVEPGIVLALTRVWAVLWGLGHDPEPVRQALAWVLSRPGSTRLEAIEQAVVGGRPDGPVQLLAALGGGLPGAAVPAREPWQDAYAVALVSLVGDDAPDRFRLVQAAEVAARRVTAGHPDDPDVLAWLLLGD